MKIKIKDLEPNPYRDMHHYPVNRDKIDRLKQSIEQTGFWDNILCRKAGSKYQLAYGHHRLVAIQELGITEVDIPVKDISDADMVRIMALENREQEDMSQSILIETVRVVRDFLNTELAKYESFEDLPDLLMNLLEGETPKAKHNAFEKVSRGVGQTTILKFLGGGWKQWKIQSALDTLNAEDINMDAITTFQTTGMAEGFKKAIRSINKEVMEPIPLDKQEELAERVRERLSERKDGSGKTGGQDYYSTIKDIVKEEAIRDKYIKPKKAPKADNREGIIKYEAYVAELRNKADEFREELRKLSIIERELNITTWGTTRTLMAMSLNSLKEQIIITNQKSNENESSKSSDNHLRSIAE